ncbi:MAG: sulfur carrier protein ThiS [Gammaproteobacteria bacterium]|nr:sulfur carrier protein ThiS [Gammaproteobacteria bacterium]
MLVSLNGEQKELAEGIKLSELIDMLDLSHRRLAIEINQEIVPKSQHAKYEIKPNDKIEIVHAIGGG